MEIIEIKSQSDRHWDEMWRLYESSFPDYERRELASHLRAMTDPAFRCKVVVEEGILLGFLFYWEGDSFIFGEHLAVNPAMRGNNIGSSVMRLFFDTYGPQGVIFEIDPPVDDISIRRLNFYKRLGAKENPYPYTHPSYRADGHLHRLDVMSYPDPIDQATYDRLCTFVRDVVLKYID